jgi:hypothetical protein
MSSMKVSTVMRQILKAELPSHPKDKPRIHILSQTAPKVSQIKTLLFIRRLQRDEFCPC